jgi:hypothetical protein
MWLPSLGLPSFEPAQKQKQRQLQVQALLGPPSLQALAVAWE